MNIKNKIKAFFFRKLYGLKFESGYNYELRSCRSLLLSEMINDILINDGCERYSDVFIDWEFNYCCWYRKKINKCHIVQS